MFNSEQATLGCFSSFCSAVWHSRKLPGRFRGPPEIRNVSEQREETEFNGRGSGLLWRATEIAEYALYCSGRSRAGVRTPTRAPLGELTSRSFREDGTVQR